MLAIYRPTNAASLVWSIKNKDNIDKDKKGKDNLIIFSIPSVLKKRAVQGAPITNKRNKIISKNY